MTMGRYYERILPHWQPDGAALFVTWRLRGSLPAGCVFPRADKETATGAGKVFLELDRRLDRATSGPLWLKDSRIAQLMVDSLLFGEATLKLYELQAWVVMANHIHVLWDPRVELSRITRAIKTYTAREANKLLGRTGKPFWQEESYDHWVRDRREGERIVRYIELNPVQAGLVPRAEDWPWSSAAMARQLNRPEACCYVSGSTARRPVAT